MLSGSSSDTISDTETLGESDDDTDVDTSTENYSDDKERKGEEGTERTGSALAGRACCCEAVRPHCGPERKGQAAHRRVEPAAARQFDLNVAPIETWFAHVGQRKWPAFKLRRAPAIANPAGRDAAAE